MSWAGGRCSSANKKDRLSAEMRPLINEFAPALIEMKGVGYDTTAKLLIAAGDNPHRIRSEAAWAQSAALLRSRRRQARRSATA